jgi:hypothetical protein
MELHEQMELVFLNNPGEQEGSSAFLGWGEEEILNYRRYIIQQRGRKEKRIVYGFLSFLSILAKQI